MTIIDEHGFIDRTFEQRLTSRTLRMLVDAIDAAESRQDTQRREMSRRWRIHIDSLRAASVADLRQSNWQTPPEWPPWPLEIQTAGDAEFGNRFEYTVSLLQQFGMSLPESRQRDENGDVVFATPPRLRGDSVVFSGTLDVDFARRRLDTDFIAPFIDHRFFHPATRWFNLASNLGAKAHFKKNCPQILDFFAALIMKRRADGKRPLLISKKYFAGLCADELNARLVERGDTRTKVVHLPDAGQLADSDVIPLIHYGVIGVNDYAECDAAYCLNSYYVETSTVDSVLQDLVAEDQRIPIEVRIKGVPKRRVAQAKRADDRQYDAHRLAPQALFQQEMDTVIQTIGRVRPYTKPREVVMFQCGEIPGQPYHREFSNLGEMREYFGVLGQRQQTTATMRDRVRAAQAEGMSQRKVAEALKIARTTVQRHWLRGTPEE